MYCKFLPFLLIFTRGAYNCGECCIKAIKSLHRHVCVLKVAVMSGHFELGEIIKNHNDTDVGTWQPVCLILKYLIKSVSILIVNCLFIWIGEINTNI